MNLLGSVTKLVCIKQEDNSWQITATTFVDGKQCEVNIYKAGIKITVLDPQRKDNAVYSLSYED